MNGAALADGHVVLSGLLAQVGAIYRIHGPGRDSSLEITVGPRDGEACQTAQQPSVQIYEGLRRSAMFSKRLASNSR